MGLVRPLAALAALLILSFAPGASRAWGSAGHRIIGQVAIDTLPDEIPAFLRSSEADFAVGEISRDPDRSREAGQPHDADLDPGHFLDLDDQGLTLGGDPVTLMPADREAYEKTLFSRGVSLSKAGFLYYNILDGYQQLAKDFAWWRLESAFLKTVLTPAQRRFVQKDLQLRQALIIRDVGWWSHFVGDGSQPMHLSIHYNGWGAFPNPEGFTSAKIHLAFEGAFVAATVSKDDVRALTPPPSVCAGAVQACVSLYLAETRDRVVPLYRLWGQEGFQRQDPAARAFTAARVAAGAAELRNLILKAWRESADGVVGYPPTRVGDAPAQKAKIFAVIHGDD